MYTEIQELREQEERLQVDKDKLDGFTGHNEPQLFTIVKAAEKNVKVGKVFVERMKETDKRESPEYSVSEDAAEKLATVDSLGSFSTPSFVSALHLHAEYSVNTADSCLSGDLNGTCFLADGTVLLTNSKGNKLVQLNLTTNHVRHTEVAGEPFGICVIGDNKIALTLVDHKKILLMSLRPHLQAKKSISVNFYCRGICHCNDKLIVACGNLDEPTSGHLRMFNKEGTLLRVIEKSPLGERLFSVPIHVAVCSDDKIHVTDQEKGVITIDTTGKVLSSFSDPDLNFAFGVCALENDEGFLVAGYLSHTIFKVTSNGEKKVLIKNLIRGPQSLLLNPLDSTLIVTSYESETVRVYKLQ